MSLSTFQTLPRLIVENTVSYLGDEAMRLLWASHEWRLTALAYLCRKYSIRFSRHSTEPEMQQLTHWPYRIKHPSVRAFCRYVRAVDYYVDFYQIATGQVNKQLAEIHRQQSLVFNNACTLRVVLAYTMMEGCAEWNGHEIDMWADKFYNYIIWLIPNIRVVEVMSLPYMATERSQEYFSKYRRLVRLLAQRTHSKLNIGVSGHSDHIELDNLQVACDLTHLTLHRVNLVKNVHFLRLVRSHSRQLQFLSLQEDGLDMDFSQLFVGKHHLAGDGVKGNYVIYPQLQFLHIHWRVNSSGSSMYSMSPPRIVPFPNLKTLCCYGQYPFGDDVMFRGNQHSLQCLDLHLESRIAGILTESRIFDFGNNNLQNVKLAVIHNEDSSEVTAQLVASIAQTARTFSFKAGRNWHCPAKIIVDRLCHFKHLRTLRIHALELSFEHIINLVQSLSKLHTLQCRFQGKYQKPKSIAHYALLSKSLNRLDLIDHQQKVTTDTAKCVLVLAILCPSLERVKFYNSDKGDKFAEKLYRLLEQKAYNSYVKLKETIQIQLVQ